MVAYRTVGEHIAVFVGGVADLREDVLRFGFALGGNMRHDKIFEVFPAFQAAIPERARHRNFEDGHGGEHGVDEGGVHAAGFIAHFHTQKDFGGHFQQ